jgi:hypothetical protein
MSSDPSLSSALALNSLELAVQYPTLSFADSAAPTPECHDGDEATIRQTEGPYFKPSSPQRADLVEPNVKTQLVEITGQVLTRSCRPVERVLLDLWHADENGEYDMQAFAIADTSLPMPKVVTGSAPSYRRSIQGELDIITSKCRPRGGRCLRRSSILPMRPPTGVMACSAASW